MTDSSDLWMFLIVSGWKSHYCPSSLLNGLMDDLAKRNHTMMDMKKTDNAYIDCPGMAMVGRKHETIKIDTLSIEMPTIDFEELMYSLKDLKVREFSDGSKYYKMHGFRTCIVLTVEQHDMLLQAMEDMWPIVEQDARRESEKFTEMIEKISESGVKVLAKHDLKLGDRMKELGFKVEQKN